MKAEAGEWGLPQYLLQIVQLFFFSCFFFFTQNFSSSVFWQPKSHIVVVCVSVSCKQLPPHCSKLAFCSRAHRAFLVLLLYEVT